ncbi:MAG TPA: GIY-YIG nuclease family protein [Candidatus Saccharibacteria bacterium]|nr:GIY-YIG nuclease family protein [Candidatus Saccharibacteria bacterium]
MYYFYILQSKKDNSYYHGSTNDLRRRTNEHVSGRVISTKHHLPIVLVYYEAYSTLIKARLRELQVKKSGSIRTNLHKRI